MYESRNSQQSVVRYRTKLPVSWKCGKTCYIGDTTGARNDALDSVIKRIRNGCCELSYLVPLLGIRGNTSRW